jgi:hypothetical protein
LLTQFLQIVKNGEMQSHLEIARKMQVSPAMVVEIARELTRRGYLSEYNEACHAQDTNCLSCSTSAACQILGRTWSLTEKGQRAVLN